jgi:hypothetical protein
MDEDRDGLAMVLALGTMSCNRPSRFAAAKAPMSARAVRVEGDVLRYHTSTFERPQ